MRFSLTLFSGLLIGIILFSCKSEPEIQENSTFDMNQMLTVVSDSIIIDDLTFSAQQILSFQNEIKVLKNDSSSLQVQKCKYQFEKMLLAWQRCEAYNFGDVQKTYQNLRMSYWPVDTLKLKTALSQNEIDSNSIASHGTDMIGFHAIEYLLYHKSLNPTSINYLCSLSDLISIDHDLYRNQWNAYAVIFKKNEGEKTKSSLSQLLNKMVQTLEVIHYQKIEKPINGLSDFESPYSSLSFECIAQNIQSVYRLYHNIEEKDLRSYLRYLNLKTSDVLLSDQIDQKFTALFAEMELIQKIENLSPKDVGNLMVDLKELILLLKIDLAPQLNITMTFSDADGD